MTNEKLKALFVQYRAMLDQWHPWVEPRQFAPALTGLNRHEISLNDQIAHLKFMCAEAQAFVDSDRVSKAMRWLGFLQGVLWTYGSFTLEDLKRHSIS